jgi:hypothetical protein
MSRADAKPRSVELPEGLLRGTVTHLNPRRVMFHCQQAAEKTAKYSESRYPGFVARYSPTSEHVGVALAALKDLRSRIDDLAPKV